MDVTVPTEHGIEVSLYSSLIRCSRLLRYTFITPVMSILTSLLDDIGSEKTELDDIAVSKSRPTVRMNSEASFHLLPVNHCPVEPIVRFRKLIARSRWFGVANAECGPWRRSVDHIEIHIQNQGFCKAPSS